MEEEYGSYQRRLENRPVRSERNKERVSWKQRVEFEDRVSASERYYQLWFFGCKWPVNFRRRGIYNKDVGSSQDRRKCWRPWLHKGQKCEQPQGRLPTALLELMGCCSSFPSLVTSFRIHILRKSVRSVQHGSSVQKLARVEKNTLIYGCQECNQWGRGRSPNKMWILSPRQTWMNVAQSKTVAVHCRGHVRWG